MVLGFDEKRPQRKEYDRVDTLLRTRLGPYGRDGLSLMYFGSFARKEATYGRSDIDAVLCFPQGVVINRSYMQRVSEDIARCLENTNVPLQLSPIDVTTAADGRFCTFSDDFDDYFRKEGKVVFGPDPRDIIRYTDKKPLEFMVAHALRKARKNRLLAAHYEQTDMRAFNHAFYKALDAALSCPKNLIYLSTKELISRKERTSQAVRSVFPDINPEPIRRAKVLFQKTDNLDRLYHKPKDALEMWDEALTFFESMVQAYIHKHPLPPVTQEAKK